MTGIGSMKSGLRLAILIAVAAFTAVGLDQPGAFAAETTDAAASAGVIAPPQLTASDYPTIAGVNSRVAVWIFAQLHLWFAAFVLAVPIFVFIIEAIGMRTRDKRYDDMAYEFIKVSITAYSLTAILGGLLVGITEQFVGLYFPPGFADVSAYVLLLVMLLIRPEGLFATMQRKKV